jgi:hypothetical protein
MLYCPLPGTPCPGDGPTPHTMWRLLTVSQDMAAVVTLRETSLGFVRLDPYRNIAKAPQFQYLMGRPR